MLKTSYQGTRAGSVEAIGWKLLTTPPGARVQLLNPSGSEVGPGPVATWGKATVNEVDAYGFQWRSYWIPGS
jgi:hypothetical protein